MRDALLYEFIVSWPDLRVISDTDKMLKNGEKVRLCWSVHNQVLDQLKTLVNIVQFKPNVVKPLCELIEIFFLVFIEDCELCLKLFRTVAI